MVRGIINIAIVDDDEESRQIIERNLLRENGYKTILFSSGEEFLEYAKKNKIDLVLLDIEMPGLNGIQVYDRMKDSGSLSEIPVVFLTGKEDKDTVLRCIGKGADGYLVKPVFRYKLVAKIEDVLGKINAYKANKTILMVDDDPEFLKVAKIKLSKYYKVLTVNSGKTALEYLSTHKVDLVLLDYFMPLYDGKNILNILRHRDATKKLPVIVVSALSEEEIMNACLKNPPDGVVSKPVDMDELLKMIQRFTDKY